MVLTVRSKNSGSEWWKRRRPIELRRYAPTLIAEVVVQDPEMRGAMSQGFRQVCKVGMTVPQHVGILLSVLRHVGI